jgi:hypothetical protein
MRKCDVMRATLACLLGCAAGAPGRDILVYREYTQPISFYDDRGELTAFDGVAPDLLALQSIRDTKAQEGLMGKEAVLELTFGPGGSVFDMQAPISGKASPTAGAGQDGRRKKDDSDRNWLAKSLALPSLGQTSSNAAESAMSAGAGESSWGWLADEVTAQKDDDGAPLPENISPEGKFNPLAAQEAALAGGVNPAAQARAISKTEAEEKEKSDDAASLREPIDAGQKPSDRAVERSDTSARDLSGGDGVAAPTMQSYRAPSAVADMSQTRQMLSEFSAVARPDFAAMRQSLVADSMSAKPSMSDVSSGAGSSPGWGGMGSRSSAGTILPSGDSQGNSAWQGARGWQGGWNAQNAGGSLPTRFDNLSDPAPAAASPAATGANSRPGASSGGYKPGWF